MEIPNGKKSHKLRFPGALKEVNTTKKFALFSGLIDTDWGRILWKRFGTHMSSEKLALDYKKFLSEFGIKLKVKKYVQKNKFTSFQCSIRENDIKKFYNLINSYYPIKNPKRIEVLNAEVAESG